MDKIELIISIVASVLTSITLIPQAYKIIKSRDTTSISLIMYFIFGLSGIFWLVFGIMIDKTAVIITNSLVFAFSVSIFSYKLTNVIKKHEKW